MTIGSKLTMQVTANIVVVSGAEYLRKLSLFAMRSKIYSWS